MGILQLLLNPRALLIVFVLALLGWLGFEGSQAIYQAGAQSVRVLWEQDKRTWAEKAEKAQMDARAREASMQDAIDNLKKEKTDAERKIIADYDAVIQRLLSRPERPDPSATGQAGADSGHPVGCTGASLYRQDGEFLAGEAARADRLRIQLQQCQRAYDEVKTQSEN